MDPSSSQAPEEFVFPRLEPSLNRAPGASLAEPAIPLDIPLEGEDATSEILTRSLARELARAAAEGLVRTPPEPEPADPLSPISDSNPGTNIRIETGLDRTFGPAVLDDRASVTTGKCRPSSDFDVSRWGDDRPVATQIAELRPDILGEFDRPVTETVIRLARLYIHLSFGAEAKLLLDTFGEDLSDASYLLVMADVIETGGSGSGAAVSEAGRQEVVAQIICPGPGALWAALTLEDLPLDELIDTDAILQTFIALPPHLRRHLGPPLSARFSRAGNTQAVETISNALSRVSKPDDPARVLTQARASISTGMTRSIEEQLREIASGAHPNAAEALLVLGDELVRREGQIPEELIDTAEILSFERAGTKDGARLKELELRARLLNGDFRTAFVGLDRAIDMRLMPDPVISDLQEFALEKLVTRSDDATFLARILGPIGQSIIQSVERELRLAAAERLLALGFGSEASRIAATDQDATQAEELKYAARLSLALGEPRRAADFARRAPGEDARRLVAQSLSQAQAHAAAARVFAEIGASEESNVEAWRARDWVRISEDGAPPFASAATAMLDAGQPPEPESRPTLARARERVSSAAELRETLDALFATLPNPPGD